MPYKTARNALTDQQRTDGLWEVIDHLFDLVSDKVPWEPRLVWFGGRAYRPFELTSRIEAVRHSWRRKRVAEEIVRRTRLARARRERPPAVTVERLLEEVLRDLRDTRSEP